MTPHQKRAAKATGRVVALLGLGQSIDALAMPEETRNALRVGYFAAVLAAGELKVLETLVKQRPEAAEWISQAAAWVDAEVGADPDHFLAPAYEGLTPPAAGPPPPTSPG